MFNFVRMCGGESLWDRYTMFYPLYPVGIGAEWWLMWRSVGPAGRVSGVLGGVFYFLLGLYGPGEFELRQSWWAS